MDYNYSKKRKKTTKFVIEKFIANKTLQEILTFLLGILVKKTPIWFFCPHVQLYQSAILDKSIWTQPF
jgi:hypothetical protein